MVGKPNAILQGYTRKRTQFGVNRAKKNDPNKELEEDLLMMQQVCLETCWKIYRLEEDSCELHIPPNPRTKNCRQNPYCIFRLGLEKFDKLFQSQRNGTVAELLVRRDPKLQPCGLANHGNFCYVNSFLQIWFNDLRFRRCIYTWRPSTDWIKPENAKLDIKQVMDCMQRLFITLQLTPFDTTDARDFIQLLRLDNEQQDVQEFHTLFFDTIERHLGTHPNGEQVCQCIRRLFQSRMRQTVQCACGKTTEAESEYRSLPISIEGFNTLIAALEAFFIPEMLTDYKCDQCNKTGDTTKTTTYVNLPQVLIIQLNRYVFDNTKERHRKLKNSIQYPRVLPATMLKQDAAHNDVYDLSAVMVHQGNQAHCGHYFDIIRDPVSGQWFKYNDTNVSLEKRPPGYESKERDNVSRSTDDMRGCYALIYQRKDGGDFSLPDKDTLMKLPSEELVNEIQGKLEDDFARRSKEGNRSLRIWNARIDQRHSRLNSLWRQLEVHNGSELVGQPERITFLSSALLSELLAKEHEAIKEMKSVIGMRNEEDSELAEYMYVADPVGEMQFTLCKHGNVPLEGILQGKLKAVRTEAALQLIEDYQIRCRIMLPTSSSSTEPSTPEKENCLIEKKSLTLVTIPEEEEKSQEEHRTSSTGTSPLGNVETNGVKSMPMEGGQQFLAQFVDTRLRTGADICLECVEERKSEAQFRRTLAEAELYFSELMKRDNLPKRTHDPTRSNPLPILSPPADAVWVSLDQLRKFRKLALRQMEIAGRLSNGGTSEEPAEKRQKGNDELSDEDEDQQQPIPGPSTASENGTNNDSGKQKQFEVQEEEDYEEEDEENNERRNGCRSRMEVEIVHQRRGIPSKLGISSSQVQYLSNYLPADLVDEHNRDHAKQQLPAELIVVGERCNGESVVGTDEADPTMDGEQQPSPRFNDELYCKHGGLTHKVKRIWLTRSEWSTLSHIFMDSSEPISCNTPECPECIEETKIRDQVRTSNLRQLQDLLDELNPLLKKLAVRKHWDQEELGHIYGFVLCKTFVSKMRNIIPRSRNKQVVEIPRICQECLLCHHGRPFMALDCQSPTEEPTAITSHMLQDGLESGSSKRDASNQQPKGIPLLKQEWEGLILAYRRHVPEQKEALDIRLTDNGHYLNFCDECHADHNFTEEMKRYIYPEGAHIFVKKKDDESEEQLQAKTATSSSLGTQVIVTRRVANRNLLKIKMRSDETVMDLKVKLMDRVRHFPLDQLLYLGDRALDNDSTLEAARVAANNHQNPLVLIVQQRVEEADAGGAGQSGNGGNNGSSRTLEKGFRDTALSAS